MTSRCSRAMSISTTPCRRKAWRPWYGVRAWRRRLQARAARPPSARRPAPPTPPGRRMAAGEGRAMPITFLATLCPEAESVVAPLRARHDPSARRGLGAHVSLLYPFRPSATDALDRLQPVAAGQAGFDFMLDRIERFAAGHPQHPPFVPHVSVALGLRGARADAVEQQLRARLDAHGPILCRCRELVLLEREHGPWAIRRRFPLAPPI